ncbi:carbohydrate binding family 9 domain-containing protein [Lysobacter sp. KIS68-7]|uniref:carbohydrate binding family 9 domain-containing protein n=1 Tax=Lysobacter sp. KIS68-7 TaxID=2904252 RepID=UPI001E2A61B0|nr:DUF5916 domain-containing protein [Lysobacter sp. KIS68-7]UHQ20264.1 carbohydrate binding family 9 domain-containing protein [Lysobacter sp. KIS68-7]
MPAFIFPGAPRRAVLPFALVAALLTSQAALAQQPAAPAAKVVHDIPRVSSDIVVDGVLDDAAWANAATIDLPYEVTPGDNTPAPVKTTVRVAYTEDALLLGFHAEDPDPKQIRAHLRDRDSLYTDDFVGVMLDTFDDQRRAYEFFVNPHGVQADLIKEEATGNEDDSWDGLWTSAGRITDTGYDVEVRIPFATLRFRDTDDVRRWGATFLRIHPRAYRTQYFSNRVERGSRCLTCTFDKLEGFQGVKQGRNLEITPTLTMTLAEDRETPEGKWEGEGADFEPGVDVAWAPTPNLTLNGTINPDFSQVETDQAQLDLNTSFALFFPEKRPFFLEGADYFTTPLQVLYTRQIADPDYGLRTTGRAGSQAYGAIVARDASTQILVPGPLSSSFRFLEQEANDFVGRYRYDLDEHTSVGAISTYRSGTDYKNAVGGIDARYQKDEHTVRAQWLTSDSEYPDGLLLPDTSPKGDALYLNYSYGSRNWKGNATHVDIDPGFRSDLGFISQVGYHKDTLGGGHTWFTPKGTAITRVEFNGDWDITHRSDGLLLEREVEGYLSMRAPRQGYYEIGGGNRTRFWNDQYFDETFYSAYFEVVPLAPMKIGATFNGGDQLDLRASREGRLIDIEPFMQLDIGLGVNLNLNYTWQRLDRDGGTAFDADVVDARLSWQMDAHQRLRLSVQASDINRDQALYTLPVMQHSRDVAGQLLYSYKVNPRTAFYAGYSEGGFSDDQIRDVFSNTRSVFLKFSYAWQPG